MKQISLHLLVLVFLCLSSQSAYCRYDFVSDGIYYEINTSKEVAYVSADGPGTYIGEIIIPDSVVADNFNKTLNYSWYANYKGKKIPVKGINKEAFVACKHVTFISIPGLLESCAVDKSTWFGGLKTIVVRDSKNSSYRLRLHGFNLSTVDSIYVGSYAAIALDESEAKTYPDLHIEVGPKCYAFAIQASNLASLKLNEGLQALAVQHCDRLKELIIPNSVNKESGYSQSDVDFSISYLCQYNKGLKTLVIGKSVAKNAHITYGNSKLERVYDFRTVADINVYNSLTPALKEYYSFTPNVTQIKVTDNPNVKIFLYDKEAALSNATIEGAYMFDDVFKLIKQDYEYAGKAPSVVLQNNAKDFSAEVEASSLHANAGYYTDNVAVKFKYKNFEAIVSKDYSYNIKKAPLAVIPNDVTRYYGEENPELTFSYVGFKNGENESVLHAIPEISTTATAASNAGTYPIFVAGGSADNYELSFHQGTLTIQKCPQEILWEQKLDGLKIGDKVELKASIGNDMKITYVVSDATVGYISNESGKCYLNIVGYGSTYVIAKQSGDINHEAAEDVMKYIKIAQPIIVTANSYTRLYGEENPKFDFTTTGGELNGSPEISCDATVTSSVGTYPIVIKKGGVTNENDTYVNGTLTIKKAPLVISAGNYEKQQGEENPSFVASYEGFKNEETDEVLIKKPSITTSATISSPIGEYPVEISGADAQNYEISYVNGKLTVKVSPAVIIKADDKTIYYGDALPQFTYSTEGEKLNGIPEIICNIEPMAKAGTYPILISRGSVTNSNSTYINGTLTIMKRELTVSTKNYTRAYGEENPEFELKYKGFVNNEDESVLLVKPQATTDADEESDAGEYDINIANGVAENYAFKYVGGKLTVEKAYQTLTWKQELGKVEQYEQIELLATASSGLDVTYTIEGAPVCSIVKIGKKQYLDCFGEGKAVVVAIQEGNQNYWQTPKIYKTIEIGNTTGIDRLIADGGDDVEIYDLNGNRVKGLRRGVNIVKTSDGKTRKVVVK